MKENHSIWLALIAIIILLVGCSAEEKTGIKPAEPYANPFLADSSYPVTHSRANFTNLAGPVGPSQRLSNKQSVWKPVGPFNAHTLLYSGTYPNGQRVIWVGGHDRVSKLNAETLEVLTTYATNSDTYWGDHEVRRHIETMDHLDDKARIEYNMEVTFPLFLKSAIGFYRMLNQGHELYLSQRNPDGSMSLKVFGEVDSTDPASAIEFRREWQFPLELSRDVVWSINMTSDGHVVMVTGDGVLIVLSQDLKTQHILKLPRDQVEPSRQDTMASFVRNSLAVDDQGGLYVVTRNNMHRVQWTGTKLSLDVSDGAWTAPYPNELIYGSGTTPALMGWGSGEDHLVLIADGTRGNNMLAFWRDEIPEDWKALPGHDRRVAGTLPIRFGVTENEQVQVENTPVVYGYGVFFNNTFPEQALPDQGDRQRQWLAESWYMNVSGHEAKGGTMIRWNPQNRTLETAWQSQTNFVSTVCTVSSATEMIYCWGARNREWTLEGTDWNTGESVFHHTLGQSRRFDPLGGAIIVAPNGAIDCGCTGGYGMVRAKAAD